MSSASLRILSAIGVVVGIAVLADAVVAGVLSNLSVGVLMTYAAGIGITGFSLWLPHLPQPLVACVFGIASAAAIAVSSLFVLGNADTVTHKEDVAIVLGAGIKGDKPTESLQNRLDRAVVYHRRNPQALLVVSGGQGPQESVTEAYAMEQYLLAQGVPAANILKEEYATSTEENFRFSKALLDDAFDDSYTVAFITTDYHISRASAYALRCGFSEVTHAHSATPWYMILPNGLRECLALCKLWVVR